MVGDDGWRAADAGRPVRHGRRPCRHPVDRNQGESDTGSACRLSIPDNDQTVSMSERATGPIAGLTVRVAATEDTGAVAAVRLAAYEAAWGPSGWEDYRQELSAVVPDADGGACLVAKVDALVVGTVTLVGPMAAASSGLGVSSLEIRMLAVEPTYQRRGVARALLEAAAEFAERGGLVELALLSDEDLAAAHPFYRAMGFERDPSMDAEVGGDWVALGYRAGLPLATRRLGLSG